MTPVQRPRTILHIISGLGDAGAEGALYRLVAHDRETRHVVVSLKDEGKYGPLLRQAGVEVICLGLTPARLAPQMTFLVRLIRDISPDAVQCWMYEADLFGGIAARLAGVRNLHWSIRFSSVDMTSVPPVMKWSIRGCVALSRILPRTIISCSTKANAEHVRIGYTDRKFRLIHNGYDLEKTCYRPEGRQRIRGEIGVTDKQRVVGMVARFDPQKDHEALIAALAALKDRKEFHVLLVGRDCDTSPECERLIRQAGLSDRTSRMGSRPDIPDILSAMDVHVLASRFGEGFPNVVAEAMACGTPSISTDSGDATYILEDRGFLVPMQNTWALSRVIKAQLDLLPTKKHDVEIMREQNRAHIAARFSIARMVEAYHKAWFEETTA